MTRRRAVVCGAFILVLPSSPAPCSSAVAIITPQGIVVGVDGKSVDPCDGPCGPMPPSKKLLQVQRRVVLATSGLHTIFGNHHIAPYSFTSFAGLVNTRLPRGVTASQVSEAVRDQAEKVFHWFDLYVRRGLVKPQDFPGEYPVEYLIAGYEDGVPAVHSVHVQFDWQQVRLRGVARVVEYPKPGNKARLAALGIGSNRVLRQITDQQGELYRTVVARAALEGHHLLEGAPLSLAQARHLVRALLEVEAEAVPEQVGRPFTIATIPREGLPSLTTSQ